MKLGVDTASAPEIARPFSKKLVVSRLSGVDYRSSSEMHNKACKMASQSKAVMRKETIRTRFVEQLKPERSSSLFRADTNVPKNVPYR